MQVNQSVIKHLIKTGVAIDVSRENIRRRPYNTTIVFYSAGVNGLNGILLRNDENGQLYAVIGRCNALTILAGRGIA